MGKARRIRRKLRKIKEQDHSKAYANEGDEEKNEVLKITEELKSNGLPIEFSSTKGKQIPDQIIAEAARTGQIREYQRFLRKRLKEWQIEKLRGTQISRERKKFRKLD